MLLRFINLGYELHTLQLLGLPLRIIGQDAKLLRGYHGEDLSHSATSLTIAAGQTVDALVTASRPGIYPLYNRSYHKNTNAGLTFGGMITEFRVVP